MTDARPGAVEVALEPFKFVMHWAFILSTLWFVSCVVQGIWIKSHHLDAKEHLGSVIAQHLTDAPASTLAAADNTWAYLSEFSNARNTRESQQERPILDSSAASKLSDSLSRASQSVIPAALDIAIWNTVLLVIKLTLAWIYMGLYALILALAIIDGWIARYIRKVNAGHESATLYHIAKFGGNRLLPLTALAVYLCSPVPIEVNWVMLPSLVVHAVLLRTQVKYYKKYV